MKYIIEDMENGVKMYSCNNCDMLHDTRQEAKECYDEDQKNSK